MSKDPKAFAEAKVKEIKNGRLAMLAFAGIIMAAQVTGKGPLAVVLPAGKIAPACAIPDFTTFQGIQIPTPCFLEAFWP